MIETNLSGVLARENTSIYLSYHMGIINENTMYRGTGVGRSNTTQPEESARCDALS